MFDESIRAQMDCHSDYIRGAKLNVSNPLLIESILRRLYHSAIVRPYITSGPKHGMVAKIPVSHQNEFVVISRILEYKSMICAK